jgi:DNA-binding GntR family transcriptional regulator
MSAPPSSVPSFSASVEPLERGETLSQRTATLIRSAIVDGRLPAGTQMSVGAIAKVCGVSATPAREALIRLNEVGLLTFTSSGITIVPSSRQSLEYAFELREPLEGMAARLAATRATPQEHETLAELAAAGQRAADEARPDEFRNLDMRFHVAVAQAAHSPQLERNLRNALDLVQTLRGVTRVSGKAGLAYMHIDIARAIRAGDADEAERQAKLHTKCALEQFIANNLTATAP